MPTYSLTVRYTWNGVARQVTPRVTQPANDVASRPVIVLLHGLSGDSRDMSAPAKHPGLNHNRAAAYPAVREHGWRTFPGLGLWSVATDPLDEVPGWEPVLNTNGFTTVNYSQATPKGPVTGEPLTQLAAVMGELMYDARFAGRSFVLVAHSRGGILARALLVGARRGTLPVVAGRPFTLARVRRLVTLHSPHQGSRLAAAGVQIDGLLNDLANAVPAPLLTGLRDFLRTEVGALAFENIAFGSAFLADLAAGEPVPGIQYATWGGTSTIFTRVRDWSFTADSARPRWHAPPFYWRTQRTEWGTLLRVDGGVVPELTHGQGDLLVADAAARLPHIPAAAHHTNPINHAEALWHQSIQAQVIANLQKP
jgi:hypothetical protein